MADEKEKDGDVKEEKAKGTNWLVVGLAALVAMLAGAGGAYVAFKPDPEAMAAAAVDPEVEAAKAAQAEAAQKTTDFQTRLFALEPFVVNVTGDGYSRYLKVSLGLEAESAEVKQELEARIAQIRDAVIVLLSSRRLGDVTDFEGKALLKEDILLRTNDVLETGKVKSVLFTEFVVQ